MFLLKRFGTLNQGWISRPRFAHQLNMSQVPSPAAVLLFEPRHSRVQETGGGLDSDGNMFTRFYKHTQIV